MKEFNTQNKNYKFVIQSNKDKNGLSQINSFTMVQSI
jgi:hypothetical protein